MVADGKGAYTHKHYYNNWRSYNHWRGSSYRLNCEKIFSLMEEETLHRFTIKCPTYEDFRNVYIKNYFFPSAHLVDVLNIENMNIAWDVYRCIQYALKVRAFIMSDYPNT